MNQDRQSLEVDRNYDAFVRMLANIIDEHRDELALMKDEQIVGYFKTPHEALVAADRLFADQIFSIQEVTDEPIDLGFWSHVAH